MFVTVAVSVTVVSITNPVLLGAWGLMDKVCLPGHNSAGKAAVQSGLASPLRRLLPFSKEENISGDLRGGDGRAVWVLVSI